MFRRSICYAVRSKSERNMVFIGQKNYLHVFFERTGQLLLCFESNEHLTRNVHMVRNFCKTWSVQFLQERGDVNLERFVLFIMRESFSYCVQKLHGIATDLLPFFRTPTFRVEKFPMWYVEATSTLYLCYFFLPHPFFHSSYSIFFTSSLPQSFFCIAFSFPWPFHIEKLATRQ